MIKTIALIVVAAVFAPAPAAVTPNANGSFASADAAMMFRNTMPPEAWAPQDAADSLYKAARDALSKGDNSRAADLFNQIVRKYPSSTYAGESLYYYAFSLYRVGGSDKLRTARQALADLTVKYPAVAKRGDATTLRTRVCGELARQGDEVCAAEVTSTVASIERVDRERLDPDPDLPGAGLVEFDVLDPEWRTDLPQHRRLHRHENLLRDRQELWGRPQLEDR